MKIHAPHFDRGWEKKWPEQVVKNGGMGGTITM